ncbi:hypothetical protein N7497_001145 [Penicillium chrysogenum]|nr:hypothetical protein N7497_001145 [Penicillium chrysogenum]
MANSVDLDVNPLHWVVSALQSCINLFIEIRSCHQLVKSSEIKGQDLLNELKELIETLKALGEVLDTSVFDFSKLEIPLNICGKASEEFQQKIKQSSSTSVSNDMRYWNEIKIMGDNVDHFQQLLCGYKMAFTIFLINEDRRNIPAIAALPGYETIIKATRDNITALMKHNDFLVPGISSDATMLRLKEDEMSSLRNCLEFCGLSEAN